MNERPPRPGVGDDAGSQVLEAAVVLPLLAVLLLGALQVVGVVTDAVVAQEAARRGVRAAVTTASDERVQQVVRSVLGERTAEITITASRTAGDEVVVDVVVASRLGPLRPEVRGRAVGIGEPGLGP